MVQLPEDKEAMKAIIKAVLDNKADLGIIFDTDVNRSAAVDSAGREFNRNRLIVLMSAIVLEEHPRTTIVTDSVTSDGLTTFIEKKLGGKHHRFKRGYKNVIDEGIRLNSVGEESHLAIETSGHGALKENHWLDDGAYLTVKLLNKLALARALGQTGGSKVLTDLVEELQEPGVAIELRLKIEQNHADLKGGYVICSTDGIRFDRYIDLARHAFVPKLRPCIVLPQQADSTSRSEHSVHGDRRNLAPKVHGNG
ncbi:hypothetical protein L2E82_50307 [Cichorium intybus]|nr:hypothetical protein L2E82_50307 [Cichorium intybus]